MLLLLASCSPAYVRNRAIVHTWNNCVRRVQHCSTRNVPWRTPRAPLLSISAESVVAAQLGALSNGNLTRVYELFSVTRRRMMADGGAGRSTEALESVSHLQVARWVRRELDVSSPGLIGHGSHTIMSGLTLDEGAGRLPPRWRCRVKVDTYYADMYGEWDGGFLRAAAAAHPPSYFVFTLTREPEEGGAWRVWSIALERKGGGGGGGHEPPPGFDGPRLPGGVKKLELAGKSTTKPPVASRW